MSHARTAHERLPVRRPFAIPCEGRLPPHGEMGDRVRGARGARPWRARARRRLGHPGAVRRQRRCLCSRLRLLPFPQLAREGHQQPVLRTRHVRGRRSRLSARPSGLQPDARLRLRLARIVPAIRFRHLPGGDLRRWCLTKQRYCGGWTPMGRGQHIAGSTWSRRSAA